MEGGKGGKGGQLLNKNSDCCLGCHSHWRLHNTAPTYGKGERKAGKGKKRGKKERELGKGERGQKEKGITPIRRNVSRSDD